MADLTQKYFDEGLSQAEGAELGSLMESSPEEALRFSERALAEYKLMGLPEPRWRCRYAFARFRWPLAFLFAAGAAWAFWPCGGVARPDLATEGGAFSTGAAPAPEEGPIHGPARHAAPEALPALPAAESEPRVAGGRKLLPVAASRQGSRLGVVVKQLEPGPAVVSVRDLKGRELRNLYQGELKPGRWRFEWDGRLDDGSAAVPGTYRIAVRRGADTQVQELTIRQQGRPN